VKPGKGGAFVRTTLKNARSGAVVERTFRAGEKVERAVIDKRGMQYLYRDGDDFVFMDSDTYDQMPVGSGSLGDAVNYLKPNLRLKIEMYEGTPVGIELPMVVELKVIETEPSIKGASVSNQSKPAKMETGFMVNVPPFISEGDVIRIESATGSYIERVNK
jgi:elongation factor P